MVALRNYYTSESGFAKDYFAFVAANYPQIRKGYKQMLALMTLLCNIFDVYQVSRAGDAEQTPTDVE